MADLIDYQKASVVSRTIIDKKAGTVTLFAFDQLQGLSEHTAPYEALLQIIEGEAHITVDGKTHHLQKDEVIILPARKPHSLKALTRLKILLTMVKTA